MGIFSANGKAFVSGSGESGQLGIGKTEKEFVPKEVTLIHDRVRQVACGFFHTCILTCNRAFVTGS